MYCFARFCCMCLCVGKTKTFFSVNYICKDNICLLDKMSYCLHKELQNIIKYKIANPEVCVSCRDNLQRMYRFLHKTKESLNVIKGYSETLSENNHKASAAKLQVSLNTPPKKKTRKKSLSSTESKEKADDIYELHLLIPAIIEDSFKNTEEDDDCIDVKPIIDINNLLKINYNSEYKIKPELDNDIKPDISVKTETNDCDDPEKEEISLNELSIKEEFYLPECSRFSPIDIKSVIISTIEEDSTLLVPEPVETETVLEESLDAAKKVTNTTPDLEKRKKPSPVPCPLCKTTFYSANAMARHLSKQHNKSRFNCTVCNLSFKSEMVLKRHILIHSKELYN